MKIVVRVFLFAGLVALGIWLWTVLFPSPEKLVRERIAETASLASFSTGEGSIKQGLRVQSLANCFAAKVEVAIDLPGNQHHQLAGREEITQTALAARQNLRWLKVELLDPNVALSPDKASAVVNLTLRVSFPDQKDFIVQEMKFSLQKIDRQWLIIRIETVRTLSRVRSGTLPFLLTARRRDEPTPSPSKEGSRTANPRGQFPSWEGLGVGRFKQRRFSSTRA